MTAPHVHLNDDLRQRAVDYALGVLDAQEARDFETHTTACALCRGAVDAYVTTTGHLTEAYERATPPAALWGRVLERVRADDGGVTIVRADEGAWGPSGFEGISVRRLAFDEDTRKQTMLVRMAAGSSYPAHEHSSTEECLVLEGDLLVGDRPMRAGDYQRAEVGSRHKAQRTESGALLLVIASVDDKLDP